MSNPLFTPFTVRGMTIPNRIVMAPMTRGFSPDGVPGENVAAYYKRRAESDVGLIVTEGTVIDRLGSSNEANYPKFYGDASLAGWKAVVEAVAKTPGKIAPQLWHMGMVRKSGTGHNPDAQSDSPSGITHKGKSILPAPSEEEVADIVSSFARSASYAKDLGFDAIELHGAHGYLIDQFFWDAMNKREDKYGGNLSDRATFAAEIIRECRKAIGDDMPIILRFSQWKQQDYTAKMAETPQDLEAFLTVLTEAGVDVLHCSQRRFWEPEFEGSNLNLAGWAKKLTGKPTISVGSVGLNGDFMEAFQGKGAESASLDNLFERMEKDEFDLIAIGRALLQDPLWATKVKEGRFDELENYDAKSIAKLY